MIPSNVPPGTCSACASRLTHVCVPLGPLQFLGETLLPSPGDVVFEPVGRDQKIEANPEGQRKGCWEAPLEPQDFVRLLGVNQQ